MIALLLSGCILNPGLHRQEKEKWECIDHIREEWAAQGLEADIDPETITAESCLTPTLLRYWPDCDADGYGAPGEPTWFPVTAPSLSACPEGSSESRRWVRNPADCDDEDPLSGAALGVCPPAFADRFVVTQAAGVELLLAEVDTPVSTAQVESFCGEVGWSPEGGLAVPDQDAHLSRMLAAADTLAAGPWEGLVDVSWDGSAWVWPGGTAPDLAFCAGAAPDPAQLPQVVRDDLDAVRLSIRLDPEASSVCLLLAEGGPPAPWATSAFVCERPFVEPRDLEVVD
ncbi:MAG: hypothetical protein H6737_30445 [Alphaproteobacteria bacterium]|nr:hypothetical protein [Alphaproteobacteria bacterium]